MNGVAKVITIALVALAAALGVAAPANATFPGQSGRIGFESNRAEGPGTYAMQPNGSGQSFLVPGIFPTWSQDGTRILYQDVNDGLFKIADADGANVQVVCDCAGGPIIGLGWSPDGARIVYSEAQICESCRTPTTPTCSW